MMQFMGTANSQREFKGLGDWFEVFRAGEQTDSQGRTKTWTREDLDQMVANHAAGTAAPFVIGHPKTDDPAWGWSAGLKREGDVLLAKGRDVQPEFEQAVSSQRYPKRSIRINKTDNGYQLGHIGFLGAVPPAVDGLAPIQFNTDDQGEYFDFEADWYTPNMLGRIMRRLRDFLIDQFGKEKADEVIGDWDIESITEHAADQRRENNPDGGSPSFSKAEDGGADMPTPEEVQAQIDQARADERAQVEAEFAQKQADTEKNLADERRARRAAEYQGQINGHIDDGRLTPAQTGGLAEFMAGLDDTAGAQFEFAVQGSSNAAGAGRAGAASAGEGDTAETKKVSPAAWFGDFLKSLPKQVDMGRAEGEGESVDTGDAIAIAAAASEFKQSEHDKGREITIAQAVAHVTKGDK